MERIRSHIRLLSIRRNFAFLDHVQKEFTKLFKPNRIKNSNAYSLDKIFKPNVRSAMHYYNTNQNDLAREESVQKVIAKVQVSQSNTDKLKCLEAS